MLRIPSQLYQQMIDHCLQWYPSEACGILSGKEGRVEKVYRMKNADDGSVKGSAVRYTMDSLELLKVTRSIRREEKEMIGIFHSHVASEPYPSQTDINLAFYPDAVYVIISLKDRRCPVARGYRIVEKEITPEELKVDL